MVNKFWVILKREYFSRVKTKAFLIGTLLTPIFLIAISLGPGFLIQLKSGKVRHFAVIDLSNVVYDQLVKLANSDSKASKKLFVFQKIQTTKNNIEAEKERLGKLVDKNKLDGYIIIPADILSSNRAEYYAKNVSDFTTNLSFQNMISQIVTNYRLKKSNFDPALIKQLTKRVNLKVFKVEKGGREKEDSGLSFIVSFIMILFIYMALIMYGVFVMRSVYEEKTSRVVEMVVSSCKPFQMMAGKILGIGAVGLTQYAIWALIAGLITLYASSILAMFASVSAQFSIPTVPISVLIYFILFFILGYLLFATLYATVGSMVNSDQDAQHLQFPVMFFVIIAFFLSFYIIRNPDTTLSKWLSFFPLFSPITMFTRISVQMPPLYEILISLAILIITILFFIWLAAKIFRVGILMYGKRPSLKEVITWLKY